MNGLIDFFQQRQIRALNEDVAGLNSQARQEARESADLRETVDRLVLVCQAMWSLLGKRAGLGDDELLQEIREIDLMDGTLDGRLRRPAKVCPSCGRHNGAQRTCCLYCGGAIEESAFS